MTMVSWPRTKKVVRKLVRKRSLFLRHGLHGLHGTHPLPFLSLRLVWMTQIHPVCKKSVSSHQSKRLRKHKDMKIRVIRVIRA